MKTGRNLQELQEYRVVKKCITAQEEYSKNQTPATKKAMMNAYLELGVFRGCDEYIRRCRKVEHRIGESEGGPLIKAILGILSSSVQLCLFAPDIEKRAMRTEAMRHGIYLLQAIEGEVGDLDPAAWQPSELVRAYAFDLAVFCDEWSAAFATEK